MSMYCPECGMEMPDSANFCRKCGLDLRPFKKGFSPFVPAPRTKPAPAPKAAFVPAPGTKPAPAPAPGTRPTPTPKAAFVPAPGTKPAPAPAPTRVPAKTAVPVATPAPAKVPAPAATQAPAKTAAPAAAPVPAKEAAPAAAPAPAPAVVQVQPRQPASQTSRTWIRNSGVVNQDPVEGYDANEPTFRCKCEYCSHEFDYHAYDLGHRTWYPHGFIYCPRCQKPLRHNLENEVKTGSPVAEPGMQPAPAPGEAVVPSPAAPAGPVVPPFIR